MSIPTARLIARKLEVYPRPIRPSTEKTLDADDVDDEELEEEEEDNVDDTMITGSDDKTITAQRRRDKTITLHENTPIPQRRRKGN